MPSLGGSVRVVTSSPAMVSLTSVAGKLDLMLAMVLGQGIGTPCLSTDILDRRWKILAPALVMVTGSWRLVRRSPPRLLPDWWPPVRAWWPGAGGSGQLAA